MSRRRDRRNERRITDVPNSILDGFAFVWRSFRYQVNYVTNPLLRKNKKRRFYTIYLAEPRDRQLHRSYKHVKLRFINVKIFFFSKMLWKINSRQCLYDNMERLCSPVCFSVERPLNCEDSVTPWSECSLPCGLGLSKRMSNANEACKPNNETRLCQIRPCHSPPLVDAKYARHHHIRVSTCR